jgi:hypothetical protein
MIERAFREKKSIRIIAVISLLIVILASALIIWYIGIESSTGYICMLHAITGLNCPGCGGTRMLDSLLHFKFYQAFRYNPFIFVTSPILAVAYIYESIQYIKYCRTSKYIEYTLISYAIGLVIFGVIRNIWIFNWLSPTTI